MEDAPRLLRISSQGVQIYGYVFHDRNGQTLGQTLKIQWFLLHEICTDTHYARSLVGKTSSRKCHCNLDRKKFQIGNVCSLNENKDYSCQVYVDHIEMPEEAELVPCGRN